SLPTRGSPRAALSRSSGSSGTAPSSRPRCSARDAPRPSGGRHGRRARLRRCRLPRGGRRRRRRRAGEPDHDQPRGHPGADAGDDDDVPRALGRAGDALQATGPPLDAAEVAADVRLERDSQPIEMHFILPLAGERKGGAAPAARCAAPEPRPGAVGRQPRCVLAFPLSVTTAVATPDGALLLVAAVNAGVTAWRMPAGEFGFAFTAPPPRVVPADEPPHG